MQGRVTAGEQTCLFCIVQVLFFLRTFKLMFDVIKLRILRIRSGRLSNTTRAGCAWTIILRRARICKSRSSVAMVRRYLPSMFTTNSICLTAATYYQHAPRVNKTPLINSPMRTQGKTRRSGCWSRTGTCTRWRALTCASLSRISMDLVSWRTGATQATTKSSPTMPPPEVSAAKACAACAIIEAHHQLHSHSTHAN